MTNENEMVAAVLNKRLSTQQIAEIMNDLINAYDDDELTDDEAYVAQVLFDELVRLNPEAAEMARNA